MNLQKESATQATYRSNSLIRRRVTSAGELETWLIPFTQWRDGMMELWSHVPDVSSVSPFDNAHGIVRHIGSQVFKRMLCFPLQLRLNGQPIGGVSTYNISETEIRIRGLWVQPKFRGHGFGFMLCDDALSMWPLPFTRCFGLWRDSAFPVLARKWGLQAVEGYKPRTVAIYDHSTRTFNPAEYKVIYGYKDFNRSGKTP